jgi:hypothetical protein
LEAGSYAPTAALRVVGGDEEETQCPGVQLGHPVPAGYNYADVALHVGGVSNLRHYNMIMRPNSSYKLHTRALVREGALHEQTHNCVTVIKIWSCELFLLEADG